MTAIEERYARATKSSHLQVTEHDGDVDLIIAAGMAETLGVLLSRLKAEWDGQRGNVQAYHVERDRLLKAAEAADKIPDPKNPGHADWLRAEAEREAVTARALILMELRSLGPAKQALYNLAMRQAPKKAIESTEAELAALVVRVLDVWLDRLCVPCNGVGAKGGYGSPKIICAKCGGSGSRRSMRLSPAAGEQMFGLWLLGVMDAKAAESLKTISRRTRK